MGYLYNSGGLHIGSMETEDRSASHRWLAWLVRLRWWVLAAFPTFQRWLLYGVEMEVAVGEDLTMLLFGKEVHTVGNDVETHSIATLFELLQESNAQRFVDRRFQCGEVNECVELSFSLLFEL